jgi:hypothetical protein
MRRWIFLTLAASVAVLPAVFGIAGNATLSQSVPALVPVGAQVLPTPTSDDHGAGRTTGEPTASHDDRVPAGTGSATHGSSTGEHGSSTAEHGTRSAEHASSTAGGSSTDDHGRGVESGDDSGGHGGSASGNGSGRG